ncbi:hypothetical protein HJG53_07685 [Sphingomonas sp. ID1715]|uniref:hypothetical protein n=1 Tax=Sphingomonas sp. ID1715 TaxID=1656898 RepID=UPI0014886469|nr:hypothetical protein [Sphingomonas sp. ID1715]NNM76777.1 hypothetical protein [Sphingomonas sp. ID1715]
MLSLIVLLAVQSSDAAGGAVQIPAAQMQESTEAAPLEQAEPQRKRVCRVQLDTRTGLVAKRTKVCRFVDADLADRR